MIISNSQPIRNFDHLVEVAKSVCQQQGKISMAVIAAEDRTTLLAVDKAYRAGLINPVLIGDKKELSNLEKQLNLNFQAEGYKILDAKQKEEVVELSVQLASQSKVQLLLKGAVDSTSVFKKILDPQYNLRTRDILSHVAVFQIKDHPKLLMLSDAAIVICPNLLQKMQIIRNAIAFARALGVEKPKIALLAAVEVVNPDMPESIEEAALSKMAERGQIADAIIDGPLALDVAISPEAVKRKGVTGSPVAGDADILIVNKIEEGNILYKSLICFAEALAAGVIMGTKVPIVLTSRSDSSASKYYAIALGILLSSKSPSFE